MNLTDVNNDIIAQNYVHEVMDTLLYSHQNTNALLQKFNQTTINGCFYNRILYTIFSGYVTIPAGAIGSVLGGYLIKKFNLDLKSVIRFCLGVTAPCVIFALGLLASCDNVPFAGVNIDYGDAING